MAVHPSPALFCGATGEDVDKDFALTLAQKDAKTAVNLFCQRYCDRPLTKEDITYTCEKFPEGYQAVCNLSCIGGQEFAGELAPTQKDAERLASQQVLEFYAEHIANMPKAGRKRLATDVAGPAAKLPRLEPGVAGPAGPPPEVAASLVNPALSAKNSLNSTVLKIVRRIMGKNEIMYETRQVMGGYQCSVRVPSLPDEWGSQVWSGEVKLKKQDAEQTAAQVALDALRADPGLMAIYNKVPDKLQKWRDGKGRGRGGAAKGGGKGAASQWSAAAMAGMWGMPPWGPW